MILSQKAVFELFETATHQADDVHPDRIIKFGPRGGIKVERA